jgi:hypothetical protein
MSGKLIPYSLKPSSAARRTNDAVAWAVLIYRPFGVANSAPNGTNARINQQRHPSSPRRSPNRLLTCRRRLRHQLAASVATVAAAAAAVASGCRRRRRRRRRWCRRQECDNICAHITIALYRVRLSPNIEAGGQTSRLAGCTGNACSSDRSDEPK